MMADSGEITTVFLGKSGSGKTSRCRDIVAEEIEAGKTCIVVDRGFSYWEYYSDLSTKNVSCDYIHVDREGRCNRYSDKLLQIYDLENIPRSNDIFTGAKETSKTCFYSGLITHLEKYSDWFLFIDEAYTTCPSSLLFKRLYNIAKRKTGRIIIITQDEISIFGRIPEIVFNNNIVAFERQKEASSVLKPAIRTRKNKLSVND